MNTQLFFLIGLTRSSCFVDDRIGRAQNLTTSARALLSPTFPNKDKESIRNQTEEI